MVLMPLLHSYGRDLYRPSVLCRRKGYWGRRNEPRALASGMAVWPLEPFRSLTLAVHSHALTAKSSQSGEAKGDEAGGNCETKHNRP